jgi:hypothetical protein
MRTFFLMLAAFLLAVPPALAQASARDSEYLAMVDKAMTNPAAANWEDLRVIYTETSFYKPFGSLMLWPTFEEAAKAAAKDKMALPAFSDMYRQHYANYNAHALAMKVAAETKTPVIDMARAQAAFEGIADSIIASGDGKSQDKAYRIVTLEEEKLVAGFLDSRILSVQGIKVPGFTYDLVTMQDNKTKRQNNYYFNTSLISAHGN